MDAPHYSVLLEETLSVFEDLEIRQFVDGTVGAGGHSAALLSNHPEVEQLIAFDQDRSAIAIAERRLSSWSDKVRFVHANFDKIDERLEKLEVQAVDGILLDLGVSSMQLDQGERGFSFLREGPLDMRMNTEQKLTAAEIVNEWSEADLGRIIKLYGEEKRWRRAARAIVEERGKRSFTTTLELAEFLKPLLIDYKKRGIHPATKVFQALRIAVNGELDVLERVLDRAIALLARGGRLGVITFHSLEDRIVKQTFRYAASDKLSTSGVGGIFLDKEPLVVDLTRKPILPSSREVEENPRSRSAKLRVVEKI